MHTILHITYLQYTAALQFCGGRYLRLHYATAITCIYIIYNRCKHTFFAIFVKILKNIRYFTKIFWKTLAYIKKPPYLCNVKFKGHDSKQEINLIILHSVFDLLTIRGATTYIIRVAWTADNCNYTCITANRHDTTRDV